jgi:hypothetical protein
MSLRSMSRVSHNWTPARSTTSSEAGDAIGTVTDPWL